MQVKRTSSRLRRIAIARAVLIFLLAATGAGTAGCSHSSAGAANAGASELPEARRREPLRVQVDRRVELMCILMRLIKAGEYLRALAPRYAAEVDRHFKPFLGHSAIAATQQLREKHSIGLSAPMDFAILLDDQFRLRVPAVPFPEAMDERWKGVDLAAYAAQVADFARKSDFEGFFAAHRAYYSAVEQRYRAAGFREIPAWFAGVFGADLSAQVILIPSLLHGPGNFGPRVRLPNGRAEFFQIVNLEDLDEKELPRPGEEALAVAVHELAHSYVNPRLEKHEPKLAAAGKVIFPLVEKAMAGQAYRDWPAVIYESGVRAVTVLFLRDRRGPKRAAAQIADEEDNSFFWVRGLVDLLEAHRRKHGGLADFDAVAPEIVRLFEGAATRYAAQGLPVIPFRGPILRVFDAEDLAVVAPLGPAEAPLPSYVVKMHKEYFKDSPLLPSTTDWKDLAGRALMLLGSPSSNPAIARVLAANGWSVTESQVRVAGRTFDGPSLVLIACARGLDKAARPVVLYTSARDEDLVEVLSMSATDWMVKRRLPDGRFQTMAMGNYLRGDTEGR